MPAKIRSSRRRAWSASLVVAPLLALGLALAALTPAIAQAENVSIERPLPDERDLRERFDQPTASFLWGPASLLMLPEEVTLYVNLAARPQRVNFLERFWQTMARNCPPGENPAKQRFWLRVEEASERFEGEGVPGWLSDRGRFYVLLGEPLEEKREEALVDDEEREVLVWTLPEVEGLPGTVAFVRDAQSWVFAAADPSREEGRLVFARRELGELGVRMARYFRRGCAMSEEMLAEAEQLAWRQQLWELAGEVIEELEPELDAPLEASLAFFPAEGDATYTWLGFSLDEPLAEGDRLVAILRTEGETDRFLGGDDFPFEVRQEGDRWFAQAARSLPPGRYAIAAGVASEEGGLTPRFAESLIIARLPDDQLRLSSVVLTRSIEPLDDAEELAPFVLGGFEILPRSEPVVVHGEDLGVFFQVLGLQLDDAGRADFRVTYQLKIKRPGQGLVNATQPIVQEAYGATQAWSTPIVPQWPEADYAISITIEDERSGAKATKEVPFRVQAAGS